MTISILIEHYVAFHEVKCNLIERPKLIGVTAAKNCCQWFCYICTCSGFLVLWVVEFIYRCGGKKVHFVWSVWQFFPSLLCFLLSNSVMYACLIWGMAGGSCLVCGVLMAGLSGFASHQCSLYFGAGCQ